MVRRINVINISGLREGDVLQKSIERLEDGRIILHKGTRLTAERIKKLARLANVRYAEDSVYAEDLIKETVPGIVRDEAEEALDLFLKEQNISNIQELGANTRKMARLIKENDNFQDNLGEYLKLPNSESTHAVRTTCYAILLAKIYNNGLSHGYKPGIREKLEIDLNDIAMAAMLQDVGSIYQDNEKVKDIKEIPSMDYLTNHLPGIRNTPLNKYDEQYAGVYSYCTIAKSKEISSSAKFMILMSKEPYSVQGALQIPVSPKKGEKEEKNLVTAPYVGARIIKACTIFDNAMKRAIDNGNSLEEVVAELGYCAENGIISPDIYKLLMDNIDLYPYNTKVKLSNGRIGVVRRCNRGNYGSSRPVIYTRPDNKVVNLEWSKDVTIESLLTRQQYEEISKAQIEGMKNSVIRRFFFSLKNKPN